MTCTHDLALGYYISDRTIILRRGSIVEMGDTKLVFDDPRHPYTQTLLVSVPRRSGGGKIVPPSPLPPPGAAERSGRRGSSRRGSPATGLPEADHGAGDQGSSPLPTVARLGTMRSAAA